MTCRSLSLKEAVSPPARTDGVAAVRDLDLSTISQDEARRAVRLGL